MTNDDLMKLTDEVIEEIVDTLDKKGTEYSTFQDRLSNFKDAARFLETSPEYTLWGFVTKHIIALNDFILSMEVADGITVTKEQWLEKTGDIIVYLILLRALLRERGIL